MKGWPNTMPKIADVTLFDLAQVVHVRSKSELLPHLRFTWWLKHCETRWTFPAHEASGGVSCNKCGE